MWRIASVVLCVLCIVAGSAAAYSEFEGDAFFVVDTGPGRAGAQAGDKTLSSTQYMAAQFTLENDESVVSIEGWLAYLSFAGELPVEVWVFGDAGDVPDSTNVYWQQLFSVPSAGVVFPYPADWFGVYGISLDLDRGDLLGGVRTADGRLRNRRHAADDPPGAG